MADVTLACTATARQNCIHKAAATSNCRMHQLPWCQQHGQHTSKRLKSSRFGLVADVSASFVSTGLSSMSNKGLTCTSEIICPSSATLVSPVAVLQTRRNAFQRTIQVFFARNNANQQMYRGGKPRRVTPTTTHSSEERTSENWHTPTTTNPACLTLQEYTKATVRSVQLVQAVQRTQRRQKLPISKANHHSSLVCHLPRVCPCCGVSRVFIISSSST